MGKLEGVAAVAFDCKTATVAMKPGATLAKEPAEKALKDAGFGLKSFAEGTPPTVQASTFVVKTSGAGRDAAERDSEAVAASWRARLPKLDLLLIDRDGSALAVAKPGAKLAASELDAAARELGASVDSFAANDWPATWTAYVATVPALAPTSDLAGIKKSLAGPRNVLAVRLDPAAHTARLFVREPCDNMLTIVRGVLTPLGLTLTSVTPAAAVRTAAATR